MQVNSILNFTHTCCRLKKPRLWFLPKARPALGCQSHMLLRFNVNLSRRPLERWCVCGLIAPKRRRRGGGCSCHWETHSSWWMVWRHPTSAPLPPDRSPGPGFKPPTLHCCLGRPQWARTLAFRVCTHACVCASHSAGKVGPIFVEWGRFFLGPTTLTGCLRVKTQFDGWG